MEIVCNFPSDYFDCRGSFKQFVDSYCCITTLVDRGGHKNEGANSDYEIWEEDK